MNTLYAALFALVAVVGAVIKFFLGRGKRLDTKKAKEEVGSVWVDQTPPAVVKDVVEVRLEAKEEAKAQQQVLEKQVEENSSSAVEAASALNDAFSKLKK